MSVESQGPWWPVSSFVPMSAHSPVSSDEVAPEDVANVELWLQRLDEQIAAEDAAAMEIGNQFFANDERGVVLPGVNYVEVAPRRQIVKKPAITERDRQLRPFAKIGLFFSSFYTAASSTAVGIELALGKVIGERQVDPGLVVAAGISAIVSVGLFDSVVKTGEPIHRERNVARRECLEQSYTPGFTVAEPPEPLLDKIPLPPERWFEYGSPQRGFVAGGSKVLAAVSAVGGVAMWTKSFGEYTYANVVETLSDSHPSLVAEALSQSEGDLRWSIYLIASSGVLAVSGWFVDSYPGQAKQTNMLAELFPGSTHFEATRATRNKHKEGAMI